MNERRRNPRQKTPERRRIRSDRRVPDLPEMGSTVIMNIFMSALREIAIRDLGISFDHSECHSECSHTAEMERAAKDCQELIVKMLARGYQGLLTSMHNGGLLSPLAVGKVIMAAQVEWEKNRKQYMKEPI